MVKVVVVAMSGEGFEFLLLKIGVEDPGEPLRLG